MNFIVFDPSFLQENKLKDLIKAYKISEIYSLLPYCNKTDNLLKNCSVPVSVKTAKGETIDSVKRRAVYSFVSKIFHPIIAYGELPIEKSRGQAEFAEFTIDFEYRSLERIPKYIIIVASSSRYGDYFEGRENSQMWLDDLQLVYPNSWDDIKTK